MTTPVVLITGALTGIGRATALAFAKEGARLLVSGRKEAEGNALQAELRASGAEAEFMIADVRHETDVANLVDRAVKRFGRLDVAVNNAGTEGRPGPLTDVSVETYAAMFDTKAFVLYDSCGQHPLPQRPAMHFSGEAFGQVRQEDKFLRHFVVG